jgi:hypothetical protein
VEQGQLHKLADTLYRAHQMIVSKSSRGDVSGRAEGRPRATSDIIASLSAADTATASPTMSPMRTSGAAAASVSGTSAAWHGDGLSSDHSPVQESGASHRRGRAAVRGGGDGDRGVRPKSCPAEGDDGTPVARSHSTAPRQSGRLASSTTLRRLTIETSSSAPASPAARLRSVDTAGSRSDSEGGGGVRLTSTAGSEVPSGARSCGGSGGSGGDGDASAVPADGSGGVDDVPVLAMMSPSRLSLGISSVKVKRTRWLRG